MTFPPPLFIFFCYIPLFFFYPFFFFWCLLVFFFLLFFLPPPPSHKATWSRRMATTAHFCLFQQSFRSESAVSACFGGHFGQNWLYRHVLVAILAISVPISIGIGLNLDESTWIGANQKKKKKGVRESRRVGCRMPCRTPVWRPWSHISAF